MKAVVPTRAALLRRQPPLPTSGLVAMSRPRKLAAFSNAKFLLLAAQDEVIKCVKAKRHEERGKRISDVAV